MASEEVVWYRILQPAYPSTGGIAQTAYCLVCGAAVIITEDDPEPSEIHVEYHEAKGERPS